eukprot:scaffold39787_cov65-Phaeocystis_antarctica.AAC.2
MMKLIRMGTISAMIHMYRSEMRYRMTCHVRFQPRMSAMKNTMNVMSAKVISPFEICMLVGRSQQ